MKKYCFLFAFFLSAFAAVAQEVKPEATEDWSTPPPLVTPGKIAQPPSDAVVLFAGEKDLGKWEHLDSSAVKWTINKGELTVTPKAKDIRTRQLFGNIQLHMEWKTPDPREDHGNSRGNSGVLFMGLYELQIYESYRDLHKIYYNGQAGSIYKQYAPLVNACLPPQTWQTFDAVFEAPVFNADRSLKTPAYITVFHNGVLVQCHVAIKGPMVYAGYPRYRYHENKLPLVLQEHNSRVSFRNIWVREF
ncbi:3-keto-disaccharide hydrolase [Chitinophaga polysaccharea]|uniref:3-keto-disaccharide hydrolase n=1 Tax=Chitinophaga polysaccharea TaxID=1293035 RepID=UPI00115BF7AD|nr:DUF1080 domain-containing protein [Chitinophaga polysaccharea]